MSMPKKLTAYGGIDALTHALESYVSIYATGGFAVDVCLRNPVFQTRLGLLDPRSHKQYGSHVPDYTRGLAKESIRILSKYLPTAYEHGSVDLKAREKVRAGGARAGRGHFAGAVWRGAV